MTAITPVLIVTNNPAGIQSVVTPVAQVTSTGSILQSATPVPPAPANPAPSTTVDTVDGIVSAQWSWSIGQPETISYKANGTQLAPLTAGVSPGGTRIIGISLDGGIHQDTRMLSEGTAVVYDQPPYVMEDGHGLGQVLGTTRLARFSAQQILLGDAITAPKNTIKTSSGGIITPSNILPGLQGIGRTTIGLQGSQQAKLLAFDFLVDSSIYKTTFDIDINRDTLLRIMDTIVERLGSIVDVKRAQYVIDSGDFGVSGSNISQTLYLGHVGTAPYLTFDGVTATYVNNELERGTNGQSSTLDMCSSCSFLGGDSTHGMPDGGKITAIRTINHGAIDATGSYKSGMLVVGVYVNKDQGGVYFWPGDGVLHPMSQAFGVNDLWYDESLGMLYASTDAGVYQHQADPDNPAPWTRIGGMALPCKGLCKDNGVLYTHCSLSPGDTNTAVIRNPQLPGDTATAGLLGWSFVAYGDIVEYAVGGNALYYFTSLDPTTLLWSDLTSSSDPVIMPLPGDGIYAATGFDVVTSGDLGSTVTGIFVRTSSGSACLQFITPGKKSMATANPDNTLVDDLGAPVRVNKITQHGAGFMSYDTGTTPVTLFAATNRGVYVTNQAKGGNWRRTDGQSNLGDIEVLWVASAPPRLWLGEMLTRVYASTANSLYISHDGCVHWVDAFSNLLDAGPVFFALWKQRFGTYPDNVSTGSVDSGNPFYYPDAKVGPYNLVRSLTEIGEFEYILYNPTSRAPAGAHRDAELTQISSASLVPEIPCSQLLLDAMVRFLAYTAEPQIIIEVHSSFSDTSDPLRTLRPTHLVNVNALMEQCITGDDNVVYATYSNEKFYVLEHEITINEAEPGVARTRTRLGKLLLDSRADPQRISADLFYAISRLQLYRTKKRA